MTGVVPVVVVEGGEDVGVEVQPDARAENITMKKTLVTAKAIVLFNICVS